MDRAPNDFDDPDPEEGGAFELTTEQILDLAEAPGPFYTSGKTAEGVAAVRGRRREARYGHEGSRGHLSPGNGALAN